MLGLTALISKIVLWIKKDGAGVFGLVNSLVRVVRELLVIIVRIVAIVLPDKLVEDVVIAKISQVFDKIEDGLKSVTNWLLGLS